jgi:PPK2 family polyphosphate:nucleotide phosphotransferase
MKSEQPIKPGKQVDLTEYRSKAPKDLERAEAEDRLKQLGEELGELEELLFAAGETALLIVLQGLDTSGKDGAIRNLLRFVNVQSCRVESFKVPTPEEIAHDFLWRAHAVTPKRGAVTIFNRSHYEDVLVVRVHKLVPEKVWRARFEHINAFEKLLADSETVILKFFLHITPEEQAERLLERENDPIKAWKLSANDWKEREHWNDYRKAYEDALSQCSTKGAPWFVVPADNKWYRDLFITERIVEALRPYRKQWMERLEEIGKTAKAELEEMRRGS